jgi:hypothetical protein
MLLLFENLLEKGRAKSGRIVAQKAEVLQTRMLARAPEKMIKLTSARQV